jgi:hypothetical protein
MAGSIHTVSAPDPAPGATGVRYRSPVWSDGGAATHQITAPGSAYTYTASYATTQYYLTTAVSPANGGTFSLNPVGEAQWYNSGATIQAVKAVWADGYGFSGFTGNLSGSTNPQPLTMNSPKSVTAYFSTATQITGPSSLHVNLSFMPFSAYDDRPASTNGYSQSCPPGSTIRGCFQTILANLRDQQVSGIRIIVPFCSADSQALAGCGQPTDQVYWNKNANPGLKWITGVRDFFDDVYTYLRSNPPRDFPLPRVAISLTYGPGGAIVQSKPKDETVPASGVQGHCADTPDTVYFYPQYPSGVKQGGEKIGLLNPQAYNCAPKNPFFVGWNNTFNVINDMLAVAQGKVVVSELELEQELWLIGHTTDLRLIYDNSSPESAGLPPGSTVDVLSKLREKMDDNGFDPLRVTWSAPWIDSRSSDVQTCPSPDPEHPEWCCPNIDTPTGTCNCVNVYQDYARQTPLGAVVSAIRGGLVGLPIDYVETGTGGLPCGGVKTETMFSSPLYNPELPNIVDSHMYPRVEGAGLYDVHVRQIAELDYKNLHHLLEIMSLQSAEVMIGETHRGTFYDAIVNGEHCTGSPATAPVDNVAGFNAARTLLAGYNVVFRPWMQLQDSSGQCFPYSPAGPSSKQNVNYNGNGPYTPTRY